MKAKQILLNTLLSVAVATGVLLVYTTYFAPDSGPTTIIERITDQPVRLTTYNAIESGKVAPVDFTYAASQSTPSVVHVKKFASNAYAGGNDPWREFFGDDFYHFFGMPRRDAEPQRRQVASGSGVIISSDGYIVTNNHVISNAEDIEVTLADNKTYAADLIGTDPSTDLALIKIEADKLQALPLGNSDSALIGEWVLAVGNPFDLTSTVTAGIISAKGRNINILRKQSRMPIESFIQTDAAVNPGNSGGALVNLNGELVGINTAIATPTGTYAGYSFAVPVNIVKKVVTDLREFGIVQRAFLGVQIRDVDEELADEVDLNRYQGAYIVAVNENSGAEEAGLQEGDLITAVDKTAVNSVAELQEQISRYRPGDKVAINFVRNGKEFLEEVVLKNQMNSTELIEKETTEVMVKLGASFENLSEEEREEYGVDGGVRVSDIRSGRLSRSSNIREGFVITKIDRQRVDNADELIDILEDKEEGDGVMIEGFYPQNPAKTYYYAFGM